MSSNNDILKQRQCVMRREMDRRGIALKAVSFDSRIPYSTLLSYFPQEGGNDPAVMPVSALYALFGALPDDILSLVLPANRVIVAVPEGIDHDDIAAGCIEYAAEHAKARHPNSECGVEIGPNESAVLGAKVVQLKAVAA